MFRAEKFDQPEALPVIENVDGRAAGRVGAGRIGHQPDPLALQHREVAFLELVDPERDGGGPRAARRRAEQGEDGQAGKKSGSGHRAIGAKPFYGNRAALVTLG